MASERTRAELRKTKYAAEENDPEQLAHEEALPKKRKEEQRALPKKHGNATHKEEQRALPKKRTSTPLKNAQRRAARVA